MIIIREFKELGKVHYELRDTETGRTKKWTPGKTLDPSDYEHALAQVASQMLASKNPIPQDLESDNTPDTHIPLEEMTLRQFSQYLIAHYSSRLAEYTRCTWETCLNTRINPAMGHLLIREVASRNVSEFLWGLQAEGLAHGTVLKYYSVLKVIFRQAYVLEAIDANPMDRIDPPKARKNERKTSEPSAYTVEEIQYILACAEKESLMWRCYILLMADTGIRRGECCALRWDSIDWEYNTISISANVGYTPADGVFLTTTKNTRSRVLDVDPDVMEIVHELYEERLKKSGDDLVMSPWLFPHRRDDSLPMIPGSATSYFRRFGEYYGVEHFHPHRLRHSFASIAITNGADVASISECLGHSDAAFTLRVYTQSNMERRRAANDIRRQAIRNNTLK